MKNRLTMVFLFLVSLAFYAQNRIPIKGKITDLHDNSPIASAKIYLDSELKTTSDEQGYFKINDVEEGRHSLRISHWDCEDKVVNFDAKGDFNMEIHMEHHEQEIESVTLYQSHADKNTSIQNLISQEKISQNSSENLGNLLSNLSGVTALKTGNQISKPIIHGMFGSRIGILNHGVKLADQEWGVEHSPNVDINHVDHIDVIKGASALKYGNNSVGGVIVMEGNVFNKKDSLFGKLNTTYQSNGKGFSTQLELNKSFSNLWAFKLNSGFKKTADLNTPDYLLMNTASQNQSFGFNLVNKNHLRGLAFEYYWTQNTLGIYRGSHIGNLGDFVNSLNQNTPIYLRDFSYKIDYPKQDIHHHIAKISAFKRYAKIGKLALDYSFQYNNRKEYDILRGDLKFLPSVDLQLSTQQLHFNQLLEHPSWNLENGMQSTFQSNFTAADSKTRKLIPNYNSYSLGVYSVFKQRLAKQWWWELGARADQTRMDVIKFYDLGDWQTRFQQNYSQYVVNNNGSRVKTHPVLDFTNLSFNTGFSYEDSKTNYMKVNYVHSSRTPNVAELFADGLHHSASIIEKGDLGLKNENAHQINLEVSRQWEVLNGLQLSANPYFYYSGSYINQVPVGIQNTIRGVFPVWAYQQIRSRMLGLDTDLQLNVNKNWVYNAQVSLLKGDDLTNQQALVLMSPTRLKQSLSFKKENWKAFYATIEHLFVDHQKRVPDFPLSIEDIVNGELVKIPIDLNTAPPAYRLWNFRAGLQWNRYFNIGLSAQNLLNTRYRDYLNRMRYFSDEMGRNIMLNLLIKF